MTPEAKEVAVAMAEAQILVQSKRIEFYLTEYTVELLAQKMRDKEFEIPPYQREDTWEKPRKWRFIESLLMGLPIPFLFFWEKPESGKLEIVDGSQRLRTIEQFVLGDLILGKLEVLTSLEGLSYKDLLDSRQRKLKNRSIRGIVLHEHADAQARFDLFNRINTGSKIADPAEIRRGALPGPFLDLVIELASHETFKRVAPLTADQVKTRDGEELVTRFFAYTDGLDTYRDRVADFLLAYSRAMNERFVLNPAAIMSYRQAFVETMTFVERVFPFGFRTSKKGITTRKARFEALAVGSRMALRERPELLNRDLDVSEWIVSDEFREVTGSDGANSIKRLQDRIDFVRLRLVQARA
jgi:hypothetical protein